MTDMTEDNDIIPIKKLKKKRRRFISDSDPEQTAESSDKPKRTKKNKRKIKLKRFQLEVPREKHSEKDDDVFCSENDNLDMLAAFSEDIPRPFTSEKTPKKRKHPSFVDENSGI